MTTQQLLIEGNDATLAGEFCLPEGDGPFPVVLMIHGSGPLDRNENTRGQSLNVFNRLSDYFLSQDIGSFRYDKRGCGQSTGDYLRSGHHDLVSDAAACVERLKNANNVDNQQIFALGHSEGTIIAAQLAPSFPTLAGLILLCPFIEPMDSILRRQARQLQNDVRNLSGLRRWIFSAFFRLVGNPVASQDKLLSQLESTDDPILRVMLRKVNARWLRELIALDNEHIYSQVTVPSLLIGGAKDIQCLPTDVDRIAKAMPTESSCHIIDSMTHILRCDHQEPSLLNYGKLLAEPIDPIVGKLAAQWIQNHR